METAIFEVRLEGGALRHVLAWFSDNPAAAEGCDACIGWRLFDPESRAELDGGEMDYNTEAAGYEDIRNAKDDLMSYIGDDFGARVLSSEAADLDPDVYEID